MSYRRVVILALALGSCGISQSSDAYRKLDLLDGVPINSRRIHGDINIEYDGDSSLILKRNSVVLKIDPMTPSVLFSSKNGRYVALNYGNGSGQVYSISIYDMASGKKLDTSKYFDKILKYYRDRKSCHIKLDQTSFIFKKWLEEEYFTIYVEDFSRDPGCSFKKRNWSIDLANGNLDGIKVTPAITHR